ncbi:type I methionyl aminopeptidase [Candidatus Saccharibacteria bacterium]|nr:MAG: type I methionyl aminopeptidase [Candidatus Saccharibacteria bacterium]
MFTRVKTEAELERMRTSGRMLATVHQAIRKFAVPGVTEIDVAQLAAKELKALGGTPTFLGYYGFPDVICISVNDAVVHGIPKNRELKDGDLASFDFGVTYEGMVTDSAFSMVIGKGSTDVQQLISVTEQSMLAGIAVLKDGVMTGDIGAAVEAVLNLHKYGIVRDLVGHGVGHSLHEEPDIANYGVAGTGKQLSAGMTIAIEPMANMGTERIIMEDDGWTVRTADGKPSAHFEHTVLITESGAEILTTL